MNSSAERRMRQRPWGLSGAAVITGEALTACLAEANGCARWLGLRFDIVVPASETEEPHPASAPRRAADRRARPAA